LARLGEFPKTGQEEGFDLAVPGGVIPFSWSEATLLSALASPIRLPL
jgi:hypothetical protein